MLTFILLLLVTIIGIVGGYLLDKYTWQDGLSVAFMGTGVIVLLGTIITALSLININTRFEATLNEYEMITQMVESYEGQDYGNMSNLTKEVVEMNLKIAQHKAHYKSNWTGLWYSEEIANLEPINFDRKKQLVE